MKKAVTTASIIIFTFIINFSAIAQTEIVVPKFSGEILVIRILEGSMLPVTGGMFASRITVSDGSEISFSQELKSFRSTNEIENVQTIATVINQIVKQGYKIQFVNPSVQGYATYFIFEKE